MITPAQRTGKPEEDYATNGFRMCHIYLLYSVQAWIYLLDSIRCCGSHCLKSQFCVFVASYVISEEWSQKINGGIYIAPYYLFSCDCPSQIA